MNVAPSLFSAAWTIARKDLLIEFRTRTAILAAAMFAIIGIVTFFYVWNPARVPAIDVAPGVLWGIFGFAGILGVQRSFALEQVDRAIDGLMLAPIDREAVYLGKALANIAFVGTIQLISVPAVAIIYNLPFGRPLGVLLGISALATVGLATVGTLFSAMAANTRMAELLLPLFSLPFFLPIVLPAAQLSVLALDGLPLSEGSGYLKILIVFDIVFLTTGALAYPFTLEE